MKKKIVIGIIILIGIILLFPIPLKLKDGGSIEFKALLYSVTKYKQITTNGYNEGIGIEILGSEIYNNLENHEEISELQQPEETVVADDVIITRINIENIGLIDEFLDRVSEYNKNRESAILNIITFTIEGDEIVTTLKYSNATNEYELIHDNTKDEFASEENRKITTSKYSSDEYTLIKIIDENDNICLKLIEKINESSDEINEILICAYPKEFEKNKELDREKVDEVALIASGTSTDKLVRFNGILYGQSYAIIDYAGDFDNPIGVINKLIGEEYLPTKNGETNSEELLNAYVLEISETAMILLYNNVAVLYNSIDESSYSFFGTVIESYPHSILVEPDEGFEDVIQSDKVSVGLGKYNDALYEVGTKVKITYDGSAKEIYPPQISPIKVEVKSADDFEIIFQGKNVAAEPEINIILAENETRKYSYNIYSYNGEVNIIVDGDEMSLREALLNDEITMEEIIAQANRDFPDAISYDDGGSMEYHYDDYTIIKCNSIDGNRDVYIGTPNLKLNDID